MRVIEILPQFERVKHLTWLRRHKSTCLVGEFKRHLKDLRQRANVFALEYEHPATGETQDALMSIVTYTLHDRETELDCAPYSQRLADWQAYKHPGEAIQIAKLPKRVRYLPITECPPELTIIEFDDERTANAAKQLIDETGCGSQCWSASYHYIIHGAVKE